MVKGLMNFTKAFLSLSSLRALTGVQGISGCPLMFRMQTLTFAGSMISPPILGWPGLNRLDEAGVEEAIAVVIARQALERGVTLRA